MTKRYYFGLLLSGIFMTALFAQPTINFSDYFLPIGSTFQEQQAANFGAGAAGENINWDFSNLEELTNIVAWEILDPAVTPFLDSFPTANYALYFPDTSTLEDEFFGYQYFEIDATTGIFELLGFTNVVVSADTAIINDTIYTVYYEPQTINRFPLTYEDSYQEEYARRSKIIFEEGGQTFEFNSIDEVNSTTTADGYGTLTTPAGTFANVLRLRTVAEITSYTIEIPMSTINRTAINYQWLAVGEPNRLLSVDSIELVPDFPGGPTMVQATGFYRAGVTTPTSTEEVLPAEVYKLKAFPNPARETLNVQFYLEETEAISIQLFSLQGQLLRQERQGEIAVGSHQIELGLTNLPSGTYVLIFRTSAGLSRKLIYKQ